MPEQLPMSVKLKKFFKRKSVIAVLVILAIFLVVRTVRNSSKSAFETAPVRVGELVQKVDVTGIVKPVSDVDLSFERSGRIVSVPADVGDKVVAGQKLLSLDSTTAVLDLKQAQASYDADSATLAALRAGTRPADLAVLQSKYDASVLALDDAKKTLVDKIKDAYTKSDDAVRNYGDQFFDNARTSSASINITVTDTNLKTSLESGRVSMEGVLNSWQPDAAGASVSSNLVALSSESRTNLSLVAAFLNNLALAVNALTPNQSLTQTTINTYKSNVSSARTEVNTAITNLSTAEDSYNTAVSNVDVAAKNLDVGKAGSSAEDIAAAVAKVEGDQAKIDSANHTIATASIRSPFAGVVSRQDGKIGQVVAANSALVSVIGNGGYEMEANVPEADIAKISVGQTAEVTLDAYGSDVIFDAVVSMIDPAETLIDNVATYKVTFNFTSEDSRVRSGMTANIEVLTAKKENVVLVPVRAVTDENGTKYVEFPGPSGTTVKRLVSTGLRSSDGLVEITSGLTGGENVIVGGK